jgi:predicted small lipoprotein YifL
MRTALLFIALLLLSACGQKGPLFLPGDPAPEAEPAEQPEDDDGTGA